jgi:hypothetical protein
MALPPPPLRTARWRAPRRCGGAAGRPVTCWRGAALRVLAALVVLVAALPSSAAAGTAAASPPPPTDMGLLVARLGRLEAEVRAQARETRQARAGARALERRVAELEAERRGEEQEAGERESQQSAETWRRLQAPPTPRGDVVHIHRANVSLPAGPGWDVSPNYNGGHRRYLQSSSGQCGTMATRAQAVQARCCDDPTEDCSGGYPRTCNAGCAAVFLQFWAECGSLLGNTAVYQQTVALCQQAQPASPGRGLAHEFNLVCAGGVVDNCVPACSTALRGDLLLMNLNGEDSKYSCELHHGLHSWVGAATDGGYLGTDAQTFLSAVLSGAAGYYALTLEVNAEVSIDVVIGPGQDVRITNGGQSVPTWGAYGGGSFTVQQGGSLALAGVALFGSLTLDDGSTATVSAGTIGAHVTVGSGATLHLIGANVLPSQMTAAAGATVTTESTASCDGSCQAAIRCGQLYTTLSDAYRATSTTGDVNHFDCEGASGTGVGGGGWYRFSGAGGDALPLQPGGYAYHCGTALAGWLSGWDGGGGTGTGCSQNPASQGGSTTGPPCGYSTPGRYPAAAEGVVEMTVCFDGGTSSKCMNHAVVGVVMCDGFLLWRLPYAVGCESGYCTAQSGLFTQG